jgi:hypothetical protein
LQAYRQLPPAGTAVVEKFHEETFSMTWLSNPSYWEKKLKIALLTLATFIALC